MAAMNLMLKFQWKPRQPIRIQPSLLNQSRQMSGSGPCVFMSIFSGSQVAMLIASLKHFWESCRADIHH